MTTTSLRIDNQIQLHCIRTFNFLAWIPNFKTARLEIRSVHNSHGPDVGLRTGFIACKELLFSVPYEPSIFVSISCKEKL